MLLDSGVDVTLVLIALTLKIVHILHGARSEPPS